MNKSNVKIILIGISSHLPALVFFSYCTDLGKKHVVEPIICWAFSISYNAGIIIFAALLVLIMLATVSICYFVYFTIKNQKLSSVEKMVMVIFFISLSFMSLPAAFWVIFFRDGIDGFLKNKVS